jgi:hypothetical protein
VHNVRPHLHMANQAPSHTILIGLCWSILATAWYTWPTLATTSALSSLFHFQMRFMHAQVPFECPSTAHQPHPPEDFTCQHKIWSAVLNQPLDRPPGEKFVYSDISMITMMYVVGTIVAQQHLVQPSDLLQSCATSAGGGVPGPIAQCYYEAFVRLHVFGKLRMANTGFLPLAADKSRCAPAWNDTRQDAPGGVAYVMPHLRDSR